MHKDLVRVSTDISFELWSALRKEAKRERTTIRPYLAKVLEGVMRDRNSAVEEVPEGVEETVPDEFYPED